jgi:chaperonin cofactor prefoldin
MCGALLPRSCYLCYTTYTTPAPTPATAPQELDMLEDSGKVFKLVGPVLMAVELQESRANVGKRLEFIEAEIKKVDNNIAVKQGEAASLGDEIALAQKAMQMEAAKAAQAIAAGAA